MRALRRNRAKIMSKNWHGIKIDPLMKLEGEVGDVTKMWWRWGRKGKIGHNFADSFMMLEEPRSGRQGGKGTLGGVFYIGHGTRIDMVENACTGQRLFRRIRKWH